MAGYVIVGLALFVSVQAKNVYPQLLLARLFFSIGGAATSTMVTAILPSMIAPDVFDQVERHQTSLQHVQGRVMSPSISSELTVTPDRLRSQQAVAVPEKSPEGASPTRLAGFVGMFTGCGALLALGIFLRLPAQLEGIHIERGQALADTYYLVGGLAVLVAVICFIGLRNLKGEEHKGCSELVRVADSKNSNPESWRPLTYWSLVVESISLGFHCPLIGLGYLGGFVARASSVGISLFIPLFVNAYFISHGLCEPRSPTSSPDLKSQCPRAYTVAAELTGFCELIALLSAPVIGFLADRYRQFYSPLLVASFTGTTGYIGFSILKSPEPSGERGNRWIFLAVALIGIGQMGTIVCSLDLLSRGILGLENVAGGLRSVPTDGSNEIRSNGDQLGTSNGHALITEHLDASTNNHTASRSIQEQDTDQSHERTTLLQHSKHEYHSLKHVKGSIAGVYSLAGGAGILLLTKLGGSLFDSTSSSSPFYMLAMFNGLLFAIALTCGGYNAYKGRLRHKEAEA